MSENNRKQLVGEVLESKMDKTAVVKINRRSPHPIYKKFVTSTKKYYVHDPENQCSVGDTVSIIECRPMSRMKRWRLNAIEKKRLES